MPSSNPGSHERTERAYSNQSRKNVRPVYEDYEEDNYASRAPLIDKADQQKPALRSYRHRKGE